MPHPIGRGLGQAARGLPQQPELGCALLPHPVSRLSVTYPSSWHRSIKSGAHSLRQNDRRRSHVCVPVSPEWARRCGRRHPQSESGSPSCTSTSGRKSCRSLYLTNRPRRCARKERIQPIPSRSRTCSLSWAVIAPSSSPGGSSSTPSGRVARSPSASWSVICCQAPTTALGFQGEDVKPSRMSSSVQSAVAVSSPSARTRGRAHRSVGKLCIESTLLARHVRTLTI